MTDTQRGLAGDLVEALVCAPNQTPVGFRELLFRAVVVAPVAGAAIGCVVAVVTFMAWGLWDLVSACVFGIVFGGPAGLALGILSVFPLRHYPWRTVIVYLGGGTLILALPLSIVLGPGISLPAGFVGFWVGFFCLRWRVATVFLKMQASSDISGHP